MKIDPDYYNQCFDKKYQVVLGDSWFASVSTMLPLKFLNIVTMGYKYKKKPLPVL